MLNNIIFLFKIIIRRFLGPIIEVNFNKCFDTLCVIGNGPSLKKDLPLILKNKKNWDIISVNQFSTYKEFEKIKPKLYVLVDSIYWDKNLHNDIIIKSSNAINSLNEKTDWDLNLYVPISKKIYFQNIFKKNINIKVCGIKNGGKLFNNKTLMRHILKYQLSFLPTVNVVHLAIQIGFFLKYRKIFLFGLDSDGFKNFYVDPITNLVYSNTYNYSNKLLNKRIPAQKKHKRLSQRLDQVSLSFKLYEVMSRQANFENIELYNCSSFSMIDSIKRKNLKLY